MSPEKVMENNGMQHLDVLRAKYPGKFTTLDKAFGDIRRGNELFIGSGCGEPRFLVRSLAEFAGANPKAFFDVEVIHLWNFGPAEYADEKMRRNFRLNSFFVCDATLAAVASGLGDYTPIFPGQVPRAFARGFIDLDVALVQVSLPDRDGLMSLGVSVDIVKAAVKRAELVIAQVNAHMPRVPGDTFIHADDADYLFHFDEPLLEYRFSPPDEVTAAIGRHVARIVRDGDTIQAGHGPIPNSVLANLKEKKDLGIHTDILTDGMAELMRCGVVTNMKKSRDRGKTVAALCAGSRETFEYINDNPLVQFMPIDYTNSPLVIASQENMLSINEVRVIDLTGQASEESPGEAVPRGIGGRADFMRGTSMAKGGTTIIALPSAAPDGETSRIVPALAGGAGISNMRCDAEYVVTEYGYAFLHGRSLRERAMALIGIAHPKFRPWLLEEAKRLGLVFRDQGMASGKGGAYPEQLVTERAAKNGERLLLRPVRISDEDLLKDFFYSLSDQSIKRRFINTRLDMDHERLQDFVVIDYSAEMVILAVRELEDEVETVIGLCEYRLDSASNFGEVAFAVRDDHQGMGIGSMLLKYITQVAVKEGLNGFTAEVLVENAPMMRLFEKMDVILEKKFCDGTYELHMTFKRE
jgi:acyl-CoA hydrolase/GNAT superfamily N-acetyltransferase